MAVPLGLLRVELLLGAAGAGDLGLSSSLFFSQLAFLSTKTLQLKFTCIYSYIFPFRGLTPGLLLLPLPSRLYVPRISSPTTAAFYFFYFFLFRQRV